MKAYSKWAGTILRPWIEADEDLKKVFKLALASEDLMYKQFVTWLKEIIPIV